MAEAAASQTFVRSLGCCGRDLLAVSFSGFGPEQTIEIRCGRWRRQGIFGKMLDIALGRQHKSVAILSVP